MNQDILKIYGLKFDVLTAKDSQGVDYATLDCFLLYMGKDYDLINEILNDIDLIINNKLSELEELEWVDKLHGIYTFIVEYLDGRVRITLDEKTPTEFPVQDLKLILELWRDYNYS